MERDVIINAGVRLSGTLAAPNGAFGIVLFAHGSGSSRLSPRNMFVAEVLQDKGIGTLLVDLLSEEEDTEREMRFDIELLTERLAKIAEWLQRQPEAKNLSLGLFGASTGAAAALKVAARLGTRVAAVVSRGGRPDLAMGELGGVVSPTLLIVGGEDYEVIKLNEKALLAMNCEKRLEIVEGATHLFEEEGCWSRWRSWRANGLRGIFPREPVVRRYKASNSLYLDMKKGSRHGGHPPFVRPTLFSTLLLMLKQVKF